MGIRFRCQACDKKLHVKSFLAGKRGVCPKCGAKIRIPAQSDPAFATETDPAEQAEPPDGATANRSAAGREPEREIPAATAATKATRATAPVASGARVSESSAGGPSRASDPITEAPDAVWYVRPPSGGQFGPADGAVMRRWLGEGRVSADALVWREGWPDWKTAGPVFPSLEVSQRRTPESASVLPADAPPNDPIVLPADRPAAARRAPRARSKRSGRHVAIVVALALMCVGLVAALYIVLSGQR